MMSLGGLELNLNEFLAPLGCSRWADVFEHSGGQVAQLKKSETTQTDFPLGQTVDSQTLDWEWAEASRLNHRTTKF